MFQKHKTLPTLPGIYQMLGSTGEVLYVGKAKNLKKRVSSYFQRHSAHSKTAALVKNIVDINIMVTSSETEALLLENTLIKQLKPKYNILFRDDKSYPYIFLSANADYPRLDFYRGSKKQPGRYFGPYPSTLAVREAIHLIQKLFKIRQCQDSFFRHRARPCLQYYIQRCSAPCVNLITPEEYKKNVNQAVFFLEGKNQTILEEWARRMESASLARDFEQAAQYRDQISTLRQIQERQYVIGDVGNVDVIAVAENKMACCIYISFIRNGTLLGNKTFFPVLPEEISDTELLASFLPQYYLNLENAPKEILVNIKPADLKLLESALKIKIVFNPRGERARWVKTGVHNAQQALISHLAHKINYSQRMEELQTVFKLDVLPQRLECFDISHTMGEATVASCVVFDMEGPVKSEYRRFNITDITPGDDYAAMRQVLNRRYTKIKNNDRQFPDIIFIDGGKGQLAQAEEVLEELQITGILLIGIAKGADRKPGLETLFISGNGHDKSHPYSLPSDSLALHLIQQIRDEAHRFAITGHRQQRGKKRTTSTLESIPGIGATRRRELLRHFGGLVEIKRASIEELAKTPGISPGLAERIYEALHT
ncbi:MAG: excinuclease ABC subunit UvrC [Gammaproteobacteria bacterium]